MLITNSEKAKPANCGASNPPTAFGKERRARNKRKKFFF